MLYSLQRRRKSQKSGAWTNSPLRELSSFLGSKGSSYESAPDPLLSPFLCSISVSDAKQQDKCSSGDASFASDMKRYSTPNSSKFKDDTNLLVNDIYLKIEMRKRVGYIWIVNWFWASKSKSNVSDEGFRLCLEIIRNNRNRLSCQIFPKQVFEDFSQNILFS